MREAARRSSSCMQSGAICADSIIKARELKRRSNTAVICLRTFVICSFEDGP